MSGTIGNGHVDEDVAVRVARLEERVRHVVTREQALWGILIVLQTAAVLLLIGGMLR